MKKIKNNLKILEVLIHATTLAWSVRVFFVVANNPSPSINFLRDLPFLGAIFICIVLHLVRWAIAPQALSSLAEGRGEMHRLQVIADYMYGATPYFGRFIPQSEILKGAVYEDGSRKELRQPESSMSVGHILGIRKLLVSHIFVVCIGLFFLANAGMPSSAGFLSGIWIALPLLICFGTALLIYSITTVLFALMLKGGGKL